MLNKYTSINRIFSKLQRDLGIDEIHEGDLIEWAGEALEFIGAIPIYEEHLCFQVVANHQCVMPAWTHNIIQIARDNQYTGVTTAPADYCPAALATETTESETGAPVPIDCNGMPITDYDLAYYRPYYDLQYEYYGWSNHRYYKGNYSPVRLSNHTFFDSLVCSETSEREGELYDSIHDEYKIIAGDTLRFSFQDGYVAIAYNRQKVDDDGYPMIPDNASFTTAVTKYITMKLMEKEFYSNKQGSQAKMQKAESDWHWYCKQAGNKALMPHGIDEHQNILEQRDYLLPPTRRYYGFFGKLGVGEVRKYNDPNNYNNRGWRST